MMLGFRAALARISRPKKILVKPNRGVPSEEASPMTRTFRHTKSALAAIALGSGLASSPAVAQTDVLVVDGHRVGVLTTTQTLKTCVGSSPRKAPAEVPSGHMTQV